MTDNYFERKCEIYDFTDWLCEQHWKHINDSNYPIDEDQLEYAMFDIIVNEDREIHFEVYGSKEDFDRLGITWCDVTNCYIGSFDYTNMLILKEVDFRLVDSFFVVY